MIDWLPVFLGGLVLLAPVSGPDSLRTGTPAHVPRVAVPSLAFLTDPTRRVRTTDVLVTRLLAQGVRHSATFRGLVQAVNASDVIVYIERVGKLPPGVAGRMMIVPVPGAQRYLRIQVVDQLSPEETIALIGHELRHALEVAADPSVRDDDGLARLYQLIGEPGTGAHSFDTRAAQHDGRRIKGELAL